MNDSAFLENLSRTKELVWPIIEEYLHNAFIFPDYCRIPEKYRSELEFHSQLVSDYPLRKGKYLRPTLVLNTALGMGSSLELSLPVAAAMQLSEEWILIHDDIEDDSEQRRGLPALPKLYSPALAINAGDALHVIMWKAIGDINNKKIFEEFYQLLNRTTLGQTIDIKWTSENKLDITDEDVFLILESKTCYYTISGPMRLGAILAGATEDDLTTIYKFGTNLGRSFQIIDDVLDITSDFSGLKKQQYNDIYEGKRTIPLAHLIRSVNPSELKDITTILSKDRYQKSADEVLAIIDLMKKYNTIDYAKSLAIKFSQNAKQILDQEMSFIKIEPYRQQLYSAIEFVVTRDH